MPSWHGQLTFAIEHRRLVRFTYGEDAGIAEPREYGKLRGVTTLLVYQVDGGRSLTSGWRLLEVSNLQELMVLEDTFRARRPHADGEGYAWETVFARTE